MNWFKNIIISNKEDNILDKSLEKTRISFFSKISNFFTGKSQIDDLFLDKIENILISSDVGINTTIKIVKKLEEEVKKYKFFNKKDIYNVLYNIVYDILCLENQNLYKKKIDNPYIILVVGVNGVGKTTTIGKISYFLKKKGMKIVIGAADTFRAAATDQLSIWADRANVPIIKKKDNCNSDPASVVFDTLNYAKNKNIDTILIDTAGRLHNKINLMNELSKIKRVINKFINNQKNEVMLIIDGSNGQNALEQTKKFINYTDVNSISVTKLDGTSKGGVLIGICDQFKIPIKYIGIGEKIEDLQEFNIKNFIKSFFKY